jgi:antitoxin component YwqK of YwqJK toxin-antitoxin module
MIRALARDMTATTRNAEDGTTTEWVFGLSMSAYLGACFKGAIHDYTDTEMVSYLQDKKRAQLISRTSFNQDGQRHGAAEIFHDGKIASRTLFENGQRTSMTYFDDDGNVSIDNSYQNNRLWLMTPYNEAGKIDGTRIWFNQNGMWLQSAYENGKVYSKVECLPDGTPHGEAVQYAKNGRPVATVTYEHGKLNGKARFYTPDSTHFELAAEGNFVNDQRVGIWHFPLEGCFAFLEKGEIKAIADTAEELEEMAYDAPEAFYPPPWNAHIPEL